MGGSPNLIIEGYPQALFGGDALNPHASLCSNVEMRACCDERYCVGLVSGLSEPGLVIISIVVRIR
jgi:hypothetical protein